MRTLLLLISLFSQFAFAHNHDIDANTLMLDKNVSAITANQIKNSDFIAVSVIYDNDSSEYFKIRKNDPFFTRTQHPRFDSYSYHDLNITKNSPIKPRQNALLVRFLTLL